MWIQVENGDLLNTDHIVVVQKQATDQYRLEDVYSAVAVTSIEQPQGEYPCRMKIYSFDTEKQCDKFIKSLGSFMQSEGKPNIIDLLLADEDGRE